MKAKIRPANLPEYRRKQLDAVAIAYIDQQVDDYMAKLLYKTTRRVIAAFCLHMAWQYHWGQKRCTRLIEALKEILDGAGDEVYERGEIDPTGQDKMLDEIVRQLSELGVELAIAGDEKYGPEAAEARMAARRAEKRAKKIREQVPGKEM